MPTITPTMSESPYVFSRTELFVYGAVMGALVGIATSVIVTNLHRLTC